MPENENKPIDSSSLHKMTIETAAPRPSAPSESHEVHVKHTGDDHSTTDKESSIHESVDTATVHEDVSAPQEKTTEERVDQAVAVPAPPEAQKTEEASANTPGTLVLQWLTYVFWGWTNLILIYLAILVAGFLTGQQPSSGDEIYYILAAIFILLPLSIVCDIFYSRKEPMHKTGGATILMILHAVIFAIFGIGALIIFAFSIVRFGLSSSSDLPTIYTIMIASIIVAVLYAAVFLRTLNPFKKASSGKMLSVFMFIIVTTLVVIDIVGPTRMQPLIDQDNQTNANVEQLSKSISDYADEHYKLPATLNDADFDGSENPLITNNAVTYTRTSTNTLNPALIDQKPAYQTERLTPKDNDISYLFYTLCVTYKADTSSSSSYNYEDSRDDKYPQRGSVFYTPSSHKKGEKCYKLYAQPESQSTTNRDTYDY